MRLALRASSKPFTHAESAAWLKPRSEATSHLPSFSSVRGTLSRPSVATFRRGLVRALQAAWPSTGTYRLGVDRAQRELRTSKAPTHPSGCRAREAWPTLSHEQCHGVLARDIERTTVQPARGTGASFDPTRIRIRWWTKVDRRPEVEPMYRSALAGAFARRCRHASRWLTLDEAVAQAGGVSTRSVLRRPRRPTPCLPQRPTLLFRAHEVEDFIAASRIVTGPGNSDTAKRERRSFGVARHAETEPFCVRRSPVRERVG